MNLCSSWCLLVMDIHIRSKPPSPLSTFLSVSLSRSFWLSFPSSSSDLNVIRTYTHPYDISDFSNCVFRKRQKKKSLSHSPFTHSQTRRRLLSESVSLPHLFTSLSNLICSSSHNLHFLPFPFLPSFHPPSMTSYKSSQAFEGFQASGLPGRPPLPKNAHHSQGNISSTPLATTPSDTALFVGSNPPSRKRSDSNASSSAFLDHPFSHPHSHAPTFSSSLVREQSLALGNLERRQSFDSSSPLKSDDPSSWALGSTSGTHKDSLAIQRQSGSTSTTTTKDGPNRSPPSGLSLLLKTKDDSSQDAKSNSNNNNSNNNNRRPDRETKLYPGHDSKQGSSSTGASGSSSGFGATASSSSPSGALSTGTGGTTPQTLRPRSNCPCRHLQHLSIPCSGTTTTTKTTRIQADQHPLIHRLMPPKLIDCCLLPHNNNTNSNSNLAITNQSTAR
ncbi:MAG: hypothetical protein BYD32DRAFT_281857 [Podila humilis]|nr:MAG: hypothetical protein BYD32DRAFT_281857 [Podila humilis]